MNPRLSSALSSQAYLSLLFSLFLVFAISTPSWALFPSVKPPPPAQQTASHTVTIDSVTVRPDSSFQLAVRTSDLTGAGISSFDLLLLYDASLISATGATLDGTLSGPDGAGMTLLTNTDTPGQIRISAAGPSDLTGNGALVWLTFESLQIGGATEISFSTLTFNEGAPITEGVEGAVSVELPLLGDPSLNQEITAYDAFLILQHMVGNGPLEGEAFSMGDVSGNGGISAFDASLILRRSIDLISCFPAEPTCGASKYNEVVDAQLNWHARPSDNSASLLITDIQGAIRAVTIEINANETHIQQITPLVPSDWVTTSGQINENTYRIMLVGSSPLESDSLLSLSLDASTPGVQASYQLNEEPFKKLQSQDPVETPASYTLQQNYPNPFNPSTTIQYTLPQETPITLTIYNLLGREIDRLVDEVQAAGTHSVSFDATSLASGTYLYRIETPEFTSTRQMLLIK